jgi:MoaA/NifB/PqqE/SkfB family radical SAM enzyme
MAVSTVLPNFNATGIKRLDLKVGYACINDCLFCVVADKRLRPDKTTDEIKQELISSYEEGRREVVFTGGEVAIRKDIFELVSFARNLGYLNIQIQTNGRRFSSLDFTIKMVRSGMTEFGPALHGHNARIHDSLTRRPGSWRQTVLGIYNVKKLGIRTLTNTVITRQNYRYLPEIASLLVKLKVDQFQFAFPHIMGNARRYYHKVVPRVSWVVPFVKEALDVGIKAGVRVMVEAVPLCLLTGYERYASEFYLPSTQVKEVGYKIDDFEKVRKEEGKCKFSQCLECKWYRLCEGSWKEYPELFGEKEFKPVLN